MSESMSNWNYEEVFNNLQTAVGAINKAADIANSIERNSSIHTLICGLYNTTDNVLEVCAEILAERLETEVKARTKK